MSNHPIITLFMAMSLNGMTARKNSKEDFLSHENWLAFLAILKEHDGLIWGRRTFETVRQWGSKYHVDTAIAVLSQSTMEVVQPNVHVVTSLEEAVEYFRKQGKQKILLGGGSTTNTAFAKANLINEITINVEPVVIGEGIPLFTPQLFNLRLSLRTVKQRKSSIVTLRYSVLTETKL